MSQLRMIRQTIYALNREYGRAIVIVRPTVTERDFTEGCLEIETDKTKIRRAIVLPSAGQRDFDYDLSFIAANKNFTYGALFEKSARPIIIESKYLPKDYVIDHESHVEFDSKRWEIKKIETILEGRAIGLMVQEVQSEAPTP